MKGNLTRDLALEGKLKQTHFATLKRKRKSLRKKKHKRNHQEACKLRGKKGSKRIKKRVGSAIIQRGKISKRREKKRAPKG